MLGYYLGKRALERHFINGVLGVIALLVLLCFAFTMVVGWCQFLRYSANGSLLFSSWSLLFFSAWVGLFFASILQAWEEMRTPAGQMKFSSLRDKYEILYDDPYNEGKAYIAKKAERVQAEKDIDLNKDSLPTPFG